MGKKNEMDTVLLKQEISHLESQLREFQKQALMARAELPFNPTAAMEYLKPILLAVV